MKILVTGGGGFIGSNLVPSLLNEGHHVTVISKSQKELLFSDVNLTTVNGQFEDPKILDQYLPGVDWVIHLAYSTVPENSMKDPVFDIQSNLVSALILIQKMSEHKINRLAFVSSGGVVYGNDYSNPISEDAFLKPVSSYGISKMMIEKNIQLLAEKYSIEFCIFRIANAFGNGQHSRKNQGVINIWLKNIQSKLPISLIGDGEIVRDYIHVNDIIKAFRLMLEKNVTGVFNLGTAVGTNLNELINKMEMVTGNKAIIIKLEDRKYDVQYNVLSFDKFHNSTGWSPEIDVQKGLEMQLNS